ncbi:hypothetical protein PAEPH01_1354 [Pancytospora epiphaga]|nr:hypothetical protein PAEPH01_1354 [Pancytospora epiphaga]
MCPYVMKEDVNIELSKVLAKVMQSSYKKKEVRESVERVMEKVERFMLLQNDESKVRELRIEFEEIRKRFYGL